MADKHPGFKKVTEEAARRQGVSEKEAAREIASSTRKASEKAKRHNPHLKRVKG